MARDESTPGDAPGTTEAAANRVVRVVVDAGVNGIGPLAPAVTVAEAARARRREPEDAVDDLVRTHTRLAAAGGFVTGLGGFVTLPVALPANIVGFYTIATRMVAALAHLRGYDTSRDEVRTAVLLVLVGADADTLLTRAGFSPVGRISSLATGRLPPAARMVLTKGIGFRLLSTAGRGTLARLGRGVPLAGGLVGAGVDVVLLRRIAEQARTDFPDRDEPDRDDAPAA